MRNFPITFHFFIFLLFLLISHNNNSMLFSSRVHSSFDYTSERAMAGDAQAQYNLAQKYLEDCPSLAVMWLKKSIHSGHPRACYQLGRLYLSGEGIEYNFKEGIRLLELARKAGDAQASYDLAVYALKMMPEPHDYEKIRELFSEAASRGIIKARLVESELESLKKFSKKTDDGICSIQGCSSFGKFLCGRCREVIFCSLKCKMSERQKNPHHCLPVLVQLDWHSDSIFSLKSDLQCDTYDCQKKAHFICSDCKQVKYCSAECQQVSWKLGHRNRCAVDLR